MESRSCIRWYRSSKILARRFFAFSSLSQLCGYVHDQNHLHHDPLFQNHPLQCECVATKTRLNVETRCACKATQTFHRPCPPVAATPCGCRNRLRLPASSPLWGLCPISRPGHLYSQCSSHGVRGDFTMANETTTLSRHACTATSHCSSHGVRGEFTMANETTTLSRHACTATHKYVCIRMLFG